MSDPIYEIGLDADNESEVLILDRESRVIILRGGKMGLPKIQKMVERANATQGDPTNVSDLARETLESVRTSLHLGFTNEAADKIQSALSKLAAQKDAEKQAFVNRLAKALDDKIGAEEDLARHVAALKVARDALRYIRPLLDYTTEPNRRIAEALQRIDKELNP